MRLQRFCWSLHFSVKSWQGKNSQKTANTVLKNLQKVKWGHEFVHCSTFRSFSQYWNWLQIGVSLILPFVLLPWNAHQLPFTGNIYDIQVDNLHSSIQRFVISCFFCGLIGLVRFFLTHGTTCEHSGILSCFSYAEHWHSSHLPEVFTKVC